jgi:hypothetical protein
MKAGPSSMTGTSKKKAPLPYFLKDAKAIASGNNKEVTQAVTPAAPAAPSVVDQVVDDAGETYVSDLSWTRADNGWGDVEKDMSNGEKRDADGSAITLGGKRYAKGLGVAVNSEVVYNLDGKYGKFFSTIGIDDEVATKGSMSFEVWADGKKVYTSGVMRGEDAAKSVEVDLTGVQELRLVTTNAGDGKNSDHGDWAAARLSPAAATERVIGAAPADASA